MLLPQVVVVDQIVQQALEVVRFPRETARRSAIPAARCRCRTSTDAGKSDLRTDLRGQCEVVPAEAQLAQQAGQRPAFGTLGREVGDRVQAHVVVAAAQTVERIQPADRVQWRSRMQTRWS
jgi:hypothetical protein